jgi:alpha-glucosidase (family GH31 glycosyl hydrolase)
MKNVLLKACGMLCVLSCTILGWTSGDINVTAAAGTMDIKVTAGSTTLAEITGLTFGSTALTSISSVSEATDSMLITLNSNYSVTIKSVDGGIHLTSTNPTGSSIIITLKDLNEHFYGITQHNVTSTTSATSPDLRGKTVYDQIGKYQRAFEDAEVYEGFYYTTLGYAGFFDSFAYGTYTFGSSSKTTITYYTSAINWYLFYGPKLSQIQKSFYKIIGSPRKVPMWGCGPLVWHDNFTGSAMVLSYADSFTEAKIPYSTIWLDRPYNNGEKGWSNMNFEKTSSLDFSSPEVWISTLKNDWYVHLVTWIMPGLFIAPTSSSVKYLSSTNYYFDLTDAATVTWYKTQLKTCQYSYGVMGHKLDRVDNGWVSGDGAITSFPAFSDGTLEPERHKKYAYLNCKVSDEALRNEAGLGDSSFVFPRCAVGRCQQYVSAIWNGDSYASWAGLTTSIANALRAGFLGFPMWGSDICGYKQTSMPDIQNYCRWLSFGVFSGFMELMLDGKGPWNLSTENEGYVRDIFNQRFNLLPYIYSIINTSSDNGVTMMPLVGEYPSDANTDTIADEYLFGSAMLVAPLTSTASTRSLYLPAGTWINLHDYADEQTGGKYITSATMSLIQIPVYIKSNSLYPSGKVFAGLEKKWNTNYDNERNIIINAFPGAAGESNTFTYVDYLDNDTKKTMSVSVSSSSVITVSSPALTVPCTVSVRLTATPTSVYLGSAAIVSPVYDATTKKLTVPVSANQSITVTINGTPSSIRKNYEPIQARGSMVVRHTDHGIELTIPRMTGINQNNKATITVFDMSGRNIVKKECILKQYASTSVPLNLAKGSYIARVKVNGVNICSSKIVAQ